jgi:hypothetical protein
MRISRSEGVRHPKLEVLRLDVSLKEADKGR